jgi:hypothetical protein
MTATRRTMYVEGLAAMQRVIGPLPLAMARAVIAAFDLSDAEVRGVINDGITRRARRRRGDHPRGKTGHPSRKESKPGQLTQRDQNRTEGGSKPDKAALNRTTPDCRVLEG